MEDGEKGLAAAGAVVVAGAVLEKVIETVEEIAVFSDYRNVYKKQFCNLARRIKLLSPLLEELKESKDPIPEPAERTLAPLKVALESAKDLLRLGSEGSKIFLVC